MGKILTHVYAIRALIFGVLLPAAFVAGFKLGTYYATDSDVDYVSIYGQRMQERTDALIKLQKWYDSTKTIQDCSATPPLVDQR